ncbi:MAG: hypothetical protein WA373_08515 [Burkholderiales bacterium]
MRLYPVPFRFIQDDRQFRKWQWISARIYKSNTDNRRESYKVFVDTISCDPDILSTKDNWHQRRKWIEKLPIFDSFEAIEARRLKSGESLALLRPKRILGLEIEESDKPDWTDDEREKLLQLQAQGELFQQDEEAKQLRLLKKIPHDFYYRYEAEGSGGTKAPRLKLVDWEVGALYWNCRRSYGADWEAKFRQKLESELAGKDLILMLGNMHRFPHQWLAVSLIYPPRQRPEAERQQPLFPE